MTKFVRPLLWWPAIFLTLVHVWIVTLNGCGFFVVFVFIVSGLCKELCILIVKVRVSIQDKDSHGAFPNNYLRCPRFWMLFISHRIHSQTASGIDLRAMFPSSPSSQTDENFQTLRLKLSLTTNNIELDFSIRRLTIPRQYFDVRQTNLLHYCSNYPVFDQSCALSSMNDVYTSKPVNGYCAVGFIGSLGKSCLFKGIHIDRVCNCQLPHGDIIRHVDTHSV